MLAAHFTRPVAVQLAAAALGRGFVLNSIGEHTIRFLPPLVCSAADVDTLMSVLPTLYEEVVT